MSKKAVQIKDLYMTYFEYVKSKGIKSYRNYCNCGGYAASMNGRDKEHPHKSWCAQFAEYEDLYFQYECAKASGELK